MKLGQHCIGALYIYLLLSKFVWDNIAQENYLCNIGPEGTDMFLQEINLSNVVLICLDYVGPQSSQVSRYSWDNITQENYWCSVSLE